MGDTYIVNIQKKDLCFFTRYLDERNIYYFDSTFNFYSMREDLDFVILEIEFNNKIEMLEFEEMWDYLNLYRKNYK